MFKMFSKLLNIHQGILEALETNFDAWDERLQIFFVNIFHAVFAIYIILQISVA